MYVIKYMKTVLAAVGLCISLTVPVMTAQAISLGDIGTIIGGHVDDIQSRFSADEVITGEVISSGMFKEDARGQDTFHRAGGGVSLLSVDGKYFVQLNEDFWSTPGPDYHVYISTRTNIQDRRDFRASDAVELAPLKKGSGASFYEISGIHPTEIESVTIWCKRFGAFIGSADLR